MAQPTQSDLHVNAYLTNESLMYAQKATNFVADKFFPVIPVTKQSDLYAIFSRADFNRNTMRKRAAGTESAGDGYKVTNASYTADVWALHKDIDDQQRSNADAVFNLDAEATMFLTTRFLISKEQNWANTFFTTGVWTNDWSGVASNPSYTEGSTTNQVLQWSDDNSDPIIDIANISRSIQLQSGGFRPNKMALGRQVLDRLKNHPAFLGRIVYQGTNNDPAQVNMKALAALFELDEVMVMDAIINNGVEGAGPDSGGAAGAAGINAGESNAFIAGKAVMLAHTPDSPGLNTPGAGYNFSWTGYYGANGIGARISDYYWLPTKSTRVEIEAAYVYKMVMAQMGGFITTVIA